MVFDLSHNRTFPCYMVRKDADGRVTARVEATSWESPARGRRVVHVAYSSLNYKDALASQGHPGVVRAFPHVPGIDCAGTVVESTADDYRPGDEVLVTGYELGAGHWGGFAAFVRVPAEWIVPLPNGLSLRDAMIYGTAGFTAAQCVTAIVERGIEPERGPVVVTGATGGVGSIAVAILAKLGYEVEAVTGKAEQHDWLRRLRRDDRFSIATTFSTPAIGHCSPRAGRRRSIRSAANRSRRFCAPSSIAAASPLAAWSPARTCRSPSIRSSSAA